ncbi:MAG: tetratricopeptide repeat protein [Planctomycetes bacterium]|jgi:tetratricopeptide (TPR) repeat protein|nr:tetratricopeptide repeat protein [Planctomycetota bacterium]
MTITRQIKSAAPRPRLWVWVGLLTLGTLALPGCFLQEQTRAKNQRELGVAAYNVGNYEQARIHLNNSLAVGAHDFRQNYWLGMVELAQGNPLAAQRQFEYAWTVRQDDKEWTPKILDGLAESLYRQGRVEALHTFLAETATRYGTTDAYLREAEYLLQTGDPDGAQTAYQKAARVSGQDDPAVYLAIAEFYESVNDVPNAVTSLRYAYYLDPDNKDVAQKFRQFGIVPGPTLRLPPPQPDLLDE